MPIYEYRCNSCGHEFYMNRPMSQASEPGTCPACASEARRLVSIFGSNQGHIIKPPDKDAFRSQPAPAPADKPQGSE